MLGESCGCGTYREKYGRYGKGDGAVKCRCESAVDVGRYGTREEVYNPKLVGPRILQMDPSLYPYELLHLEGFFKSRLFAFLPHVFHSCVLLATLDR